MYFFKGLALGFILAMSIGPIAIICISKTIEKGWRLGISVAMGAATADGIYGSLAGLGITFFPNSNIPKIIGGAFLIYLGLKSIRKHIIKKSSNFNSTELIKTYFTIVGLTMINPSTIITFMAAFAGMGISDGGLILGLGVFIGSTLWHCVLVTLANILKDRINLGFLNKFSGLLLCSFGLISFLSLLP